MSLLGSWSRKASPEKMRFNLSLEASVGYNRWRVGRDEREHI